MIDKVIEVLNTPTIINFINCVMKFPLFCIFFKPAEINFTSYIIQDWRVFDSFSIHS